MIALIMCGGRGTRMGGGQEKLLLRYKKPIIQHVISALEESGCFSRTVCATSPNGPRTAAFVKDLGIEVVETPGVGYVEDLAGALKSFKEPVFVVSGDLALLDAEVVKTIAALYDGRRPWTSILVSRKFLGMAGIRPEYVVRYGNEECGYTGISIVNPMEVEEMRHVQESYVVINDRRVAVNLNTRKDWELLGTA